MTVEFNATMQRVNGNAEVVCNEEVADDAEVIQFDSDVPDSRGGAAVGTEWRWQSHNVRLTADNAWLPPVMEAVEADLMDVSLVWTKGIVEDDVPRQECNVPDITCGLRAPDHGRLVAWQTLLSEDVLVGTFDSCKEDAADEYLVWSKEVDDVNLDEGLVQLDSTINVEGLRWELDKARDAWDRDFCLHQA